MSHRQRGRCAVVGAGLLGLAAARSLARRGWDTVVFEAADAPGHDRSGSKGDARVFRLGYPDPVYVEMALAARARWRDLETATGTHLLQVTGQVTFGRDVPAIARALRASGVATESLSPKEAARRFPSIDAAGPVLFEPDSGVLAADRCLRALQAATDGRVALRGGVEVVALEDDLQADHVTVVLSGGAAAERADVVVNCAGHRALALLGARRGTAPSLPQVAYFARRDATEPLPPVFIEWGPEMIYGLPVPAAGGGPHAGLYKVSHHTPGPPLDPADPDADPDPFQEDDPALLARLVHAVRRLLPGLDPAPVATERCVYDSTADGDFVVDRVGRVVIGCGTSGHAFKFGPLLGELLADLAEEGTPAVDLSRFSLARLPR
jgi:sarcosine oxidase